MIKIKLDELVYMVLEADKVGLGEFFRCLDIEIEQEKYDEYWLELNKRGID